MKLAALPLSLVLTLYLGQPILASPVDNYANKCDISCIGALIREKPNPKSFCSKYLYPYGAPTRRTTITASPAAITTGCTTVIKTVLSTSTDVFSVAKSTITLPVITITQYASTVVVATGPTPIVNKRHPLPNPNPARSCTDVFDCESRLISIACSLIYEIPTSTITVTPSGPKQCKVSRTTTVATRLFTEITAGVATVSPGPDSTTTGGILTTTVPAACVQALYTPPEDIKGDFLEITSYPLFPQSGLECCALCYKTTNCVASAFSGDLMACQLLLIQNGSTGLDSKKSGVCPKGVQDLSFIRDDSFGESVFVGPCGK